MSINFNIGLLGHVDSGKTSLARALSSISSTAAFDKNPQSKERGITLDLGFSATRVPVPEQIKHLRPDLQEIQLTFVDCPGHASLIRTIIGGAQIINLMLLVIDGKKGIQTQTAECIVIGEILDCMLIVVVNKIDLFDDATREADLLKLHNHLRKVFSKTKFGTKFPIYNVSAEKRMNIEDLLNGISSLAEYSQHDADEPLMVYADHCFTIKGKGTICTGTILQGKLAVGDTIEMPALKEERKIKSIQIFHNSVKAASAGDRVGICLTQFDSQLFERGILCKPGFIKSIFAACIRLNQIAYYKFPLRSKNKVHITIGHETVMARITLFKATNLEQTAFEVTAEYEYIDELSQEDSVSPNPVFVLLQFEHAVLAKHKTKIIAAKLDLDGQSNHCRLAFYGEIEWLTHSVNYESEELVNFKIFKRKQKQGFIQRFINPRQIIAQNLFKKEENRDIYVGKQVNLCTGEKGCIESTFGQTCKVKISFLEDLKKETIDLLTNGHPSDVKVTLMYKKYMFKKNKSIFQ